MWLWKSLEGLEAEQAGVLLKLGLVWIGSGGSDITKTGF